MRVSTQLFVAVAFLVLGAGCRERTPHEIVAESITEGFVSANARPLTDPLADVVHKGLDIPPELLASNRVTLVEIILRKSKGKRQTVFKDDTLRPPADGGMITGVDHASNVGVFYPASLSQPNIELRVNYFCDMGDFVAVHIVVPNPLLQSKPK